MMRFAFGMSVFTLMAAAAVHPARADGYGPGPRYYAQGVYNWSGFYIGGNVGYSWGRSDSDNFADGIATSTDLTKLNGVAHMEEAHMEGGPQAQQEEERK